MNSRQLKDRQKEIRQKRTKLWQDILQLGPFLRGSMCVLKRPCTRSSCRQCKAGAKHPTTYYSVKQHGHTKLIYLPKAVQATAKRYIKNGDRARTLLDKLMDCDIEQLRHEITKLK